jgi:hypothetical protein
MSTLTINEAIEKIKQQHTEELARTVESLNKDLAESLANVERAYLARCLLSSAGFKVELPTYRYDATHLTLRVLPKELPQVRVALGCPLKWAGNELHDSKTRTIRVVFKPADFPNVTIEYIHKIPRTRKGKPAPKCQIKRFRQKGYSYSTLVCERA